MLQLQLQQIIKQRGISNPLKYLAANGFTYHTAHRLLHNSVDSISFYNIESLCLLLNCSINDLFVYSKNSNTKIDAEHPLNKLTAQANTVNISQTLQQLPYDKIKQLEKLVNDLKDS